jgi:hypothetical protein
MIFKHNRYSIKPLLLGPLAALIALINLQLSAAVLIKDKQWANQSMINVVFLDGPKHAHQKVIKIAPLWLQQSGLRFKFYGPLSRLPQDKHIRVSFKSHSGSLLGNHNDYQSNYPTMNLKSLVVGQLSAQEVKRLILHEFGHALGFEHEYRSKYWPYGNAALNQVKESCYPQMQSIGYDKASAKTHCDRINSRLSNANALTTAYDERSIMNYSMSFTTKDGNNKVIPANFKLSLLDKYAIRRWYPE